MIYYFLVEKVHIIRTASNSRFKSKLWLFNFFGVICRYTKRPRKSQCLISFLGPYVVLVVLNFVLYVSVWLGNCQQANVVIAASRISTRRASASLE
jgi:hypothetical protein